GWIAGRAHSMPRHHLSKLFATQVRDNGYTESEALAFTSAFLSILPRGDHEYPAEEHEDVVRAIYQWPARSPWTAKIRDVRDPVTLRNPNKEWIVQSNRMADIPDTNPPVHPPINRFGPDDERAVTTLIMYLGIGLEPTPCPFHRVPLLQHRERPHNGLT